MSKQEIRIYALPTNKLSNIFKCHNDYFQYDEDKGENYEKSSIEFYHLYVISNEELKESEISKGEGYYNMNTNKIHIWGTSNYYDIKGKRKILSTDDKDLKSDTRVKCPECNATGFKDFPNSCINCNRTGVVLKSLPLISPEFQQAWVREMNNSTPIVDVIMEMEEIYHPPVISGGLRPIGEIGGKELTHFPSSIEYKPKLNPQGYVTILPSKKPSIIDEILEYLVKNRYNETNPVMYAFIASKHQSILSVKEKMYTKTEVIDLISDFIKCKDGLNQNFDIKYHNKWIDQNL